MKSISFLNSSKDMNLSIANTNVPFSKFVKKMVYIKVLKKSLGFISFFIKKYISPSSFPRERRRFDNIIDLTHEMVK
jgi:hypothetical protein